MDGDNQFQHLDQSLKRRALTEEEMEILLMEDHKGMDAMEEDLLDEELLQIFRFGTPPKEKPIEVLGKLILISIIVLLTIGSICHLWGDFNIHVDLPSSPLVTDFVTLLDCLGLSQSVSVPTHTHGHTLDLLITRGLDISNLSVSDISLSDHFLITANINLPVPSATTDTVISFCAKNLLNPIILSECVSSSPLTGTLPSSVDGALTLYNATLTQIIDTVALFTTRTVKKHRNCPWYTLELQLLKSACCKSECKWRSSGLTVHREIWTDHLSSYRRVLAASRVKYFSEIISVGHAKPNILFKTIDQILHPATDKSISHSSSSFGTKSTPFILHSPPTNPV
ncbi:hypothetical protein EOD39_8321 [Acipenser ruthenus]|uniref:Uncharacterized protein n=1 Tax=Acipenser ruthenus TaxID=7906 RepID=A0A662YZE9_ACIRT|nr:hypothetical protein EOD39_8321 [Acipenser ruthenus]